MNERKLSEIQKEYRAFFLDKMRLYDVKSPAELTKQKKSKFFTEIKQDWAKHKLANIKLKEAKQKTLTIVKEPVEVYEETDSNKNGTKQTSPVNKWPKQEYETQLPKDKRQPSTLDRKNR